MIDRIPSSGPSPSKSRFFLDVAAGMQFLALFYTLSAAEQDEVFELMRGFSINDNQRAEER